MLKMRFISPLSVIVPRMRKKALLVRLNLNVYRNLHYHDNNDAKGIYNARMAYQMIGSKFKKVSMRFYLYKPSKHKIDSMNIFSIVDKFFCDALVAHECLVDDSDEFIIDKYFKPMGVDKDNPRMEIEVEDV